MHRILERQIRKFLEANTPKSKEWDEFFKAVSGTYEHYDEDRALIERSMELSSKELTESNQSLKETASRTNLLLESTDEGIFGLDLDGNCTFINKAGAKMFQHKPEELLGKNMHVITHYKRMDGTPYQSSQCPIMNSYKTGKGVRIENEFFWRKDGTAFPIEYSSYPITENNFIKGVVVTFSDISERKKRQSELLKLSSVVAQSSDSIIITDKNGIIEYVNPAFEKQTGYSSKEAMGKNPKILQSGKHDKKFYENLWNTILSGSIFSSEFINKKKGGTIFYEDQTIAPIRDDHGNIINFFSTGRDISDRKKAEEEIKKLNEQLKTKIEELERFNKFAVGRELRMVELKNKIRALEQQLANGNNLTTMPKND